MLWQKYCSDAVSIKHPGSPCGVQEAMFPGFTCETDLVPGGNIMVTL